MELVGDLGLERLGPLEPEIGVEFLATDPLRIRVTVPVEGNELHAVLDEEMNVVSVDEQGPDESMEKGKE